eukprot:934983-Amphidinium_carterae.1
MKLNIWNLTEWDRVLAFDSDMLMLYPLDHVFELFPDAHLAAAPRSQHVQVTKSGYFQFNGGLMLVRPNVAIFKNLKNRAEKLQKCSMNVEQPFYD